jgi:peptidoglycan hydrolase-like protein with peptidoglycan-binding domain
MFSVSNTTQMAISKNADFNGVSWQVCQNNFINNSTATLFIKFRSSDGGESPVYTIINDQKATMTPVKVRKAFIRDLKQGMSGNDVKELQKYLNSNGFLVDTTGVGSPGRENTYFGKLTKQALIRFQKANKIFPAVGYFGPVTRKILNSK